MSSDEDWSEVFNAVQLGRRELVVRGDDKAKTAKRTLPCAMFVADRFSLLSISGTGLEAVPAGVASLGGVRELLLFSNRISAVDAAVCRLSELRVLDLSRNAIERPPDALDALKNLASLNLSDNRIAALPECFSRLAAVRELNLARNLLDDFAALCSERNAHLADLNLAGNKIVGVPGAVAALPSLKRLDLSQNAIAVAPVELSAAPKIKEVALQGNPLKDSRLAKLVAQCKPKQILDYIKGNCPKADAVVHAKKNIVTEVEPATLADASSTAPAATPAPPDSDEMIVTKAPEDGPVVKVDELVRQVRAHIVCCVVEGLVFTEDTFKKFIQMQTKLHDGLCEKRNAATIATHDMDKLPPGDLLYTARAPYSVQIKPLARNKTYSGLELYTKLRKEAEDLRKEKKRNAFSGIHKYLYLLEGKSLYPCLENSKGEVISFPPITNSDITKMSHETKTMLVEVTSSQNQTICRKVLDQFLLETLNMGVGGRADGGEGPAERLIARHRLRIRQTKIVDLEGKMRVVYPSKVDLFYEDNKKTLRISRE